MKKYLSEAEVAAELQMLEKDYGLFSLRVRGFSPWRILRFPVGLALQNIPFQAPSLPKPLLFKACIRSLIDIARLPRAQSYAVKSYSSALRSKSSGGYDDVYFGALSKTFQGGVRFYSVNAAGYDKRLSLWQGATADTTAIVVIGYILSLCFPLKEGDDVFEKISTVIASRLGGNFFSPTRIRRMFSAFWWQSLLYSYLLRYTGVKTVFVADTGERALLKAARENHCLFVELQHGIFSPNHPDALPINSELDSSDEGLLLPDMIGLYGDYWFNIHRHTLLGKTNRIKPVGASLIEDFRLRRQANVHEGFLSLLVTTQGLAREELITFLREFLSACPSPFILNIKLHPIYDMNPEPYRDAFGADGRVNIISGKAQPDTYELFTTCNLHLSISSNCHYDAIGLQVPTIVLGLPNHELVLNLVLAGEALLARNGVELADIVATKSWLPVPELVADKYYRHGFYETLEKWIKRF
jgi:hypothetical protein